MRLLLLLLLLLYIIIISRGCAKCVYYYNY